MRAERYEYYCDVVETGRFERLHGNLNDLGRKGWRLAHVVPHRTGDPGDVLLVWERRVQATGGSGGPAPAGRATEEGGDDG